MNKRVLVWFSTLCALAAMIASQARAGDAPWKNYFPLGKDTAWTYELTNHHTEQKRRYHVVVKGPLFIPEMKQTLVILDEDQLGEHRPVGYFEDEKGFLNRFIYLEYEGAKITFPGTKSTGERILPPDLIVTRSWQDNPVVAGVTSHSRFRIDSGLEVQVPAGKFKDCVLVEETVEGEPALEAVTHEPAHDIFRDWYAPGVGMVRSEAYNEKFVEHPEVTHELVEFHAH
jgi:hypothetical protein